MDVNTFCTQSSVLVVAGKGGVGKSTVSTALATLAARNGLSVLLGELEARTGPSAALAHCARTRDHLVPSSAAAGDPSRRSPQIRTRTLTPEDALVEYLVDHGFRRGARRLPKSGVFDGGAPGV